MKRLWKRISFRIIILTAIVFVPVLIFLIIFNIQSTRNATDSLIQENQGNLDTAVQQLDNIFEVTETLLKTVNNDTSLLNKIRYYNPNTHAVDSGAPLESDTAADSDAPLGADAAADSDAPPKSSVPADDDDDDGGATDPEIEYHRAAQLLFNHLQDSMAVSDFTQNTFIYFPEQELFFNSRKDTMMTEYIYGLIEADLSDGANNPMKIYQKTWSPVNVDGQWYILRIWKYNPKANGYYIGAWFTAEKLLDSIHISVGENDRLFIANAKGTYYNSSGIYVKPDNVISGDMITYQKHNAFSQAQESEESYYYIFARSEKAPLRLVKLLNTETVRALAPDISMAIVIMSLCFILLILLFTVCIRRWLLQPMSATMHSMDIIRGGDISHRIPVNPKDCIEFTSLGTLFNDMMDQVNQLKNQIYEGQLERQEIRLEYLQQQIQPHFILNTLNTLYNHTEDEVQKEIILLMTKYYRFVVNVDSRYVQLGQELEHIKNYLKLQQIRYPGAFEYDIRCDESLEIIPVPPFLIESFVGNTIKHALNFSDCVQIRVEAFLLDTFTTRIRISDTGEGIDEEVLDMIDDYLENKTISEELGVGIRNSIERLRLIYGDKAAIRLYNSDAGGAVVEIDLLLQVPENKA